MSEGFEVESLEMIWDTLREKERDWEEKSTKFKTFGVKLLCKIPLRSVSFNKNIIHKHDSSLMLDSLGY